MKALNTILAMAGAFVLLLCGGAAAGPIEDARAAFARADYLTAVALLKPLAEQGNGEAQQGIGIAYDLGYGVPQSFSTAATWYRRAAEGGNAAGQFRLAFLYDFGLGVQEDEAKAANWYRKAADQGLAAAEDRLAGLYFRGLGVARDSQQAWDWSIRAYDHGDLSAVEIPCQMQRMRTVPPNASRQADKWCDLEQATFSADHWVGTEPIPPTLTNDQVIATLHQFAGFSLTPRPTGPTDGAQYYAAVTMRRPTSMDVLPSFGRHYGLMSEGGSARISIRGIHLARYLLNDWHGQTEAGVHIVPEKDLPRVFDGGCSVTNTAFDVTRHVALQQCNGVA
jgi:hypothetical protein